MNKMALLFGVLLIALGLVGYLGGASSTPSSTSEPGAAQTTEAGGKEKAASLTALIPAIFGGLLAVCGMIGSQPNLRKHAMHAAAGISALGAIVGGGRFASKAPSLFAEQASGNPRATIFVGLFALICLIYVVLSVQSFLKARRERTATSK